VAPEAGVPGAGLMSVGVPPTMPLPNGSLSLPGAGVAGVLPLAVVVVLVVVVLFLVLVLVLRLLGVLVVVLVLHLLRVLGVVVLMLLGAHLAVIAIGALALHLAVVRTVVVTAVALGEGAVRDDENGAGCEHRGNSLQ